MKALLLIIVCGFLLFTCWPVALVVFIVGMVGWLILLPFKIIGFTLAIVFKVFAAILLIPFILLLLLLF